MSVLAKIRQAGYEVKLHDGGLMVAHASALTQAQRAFLKTHKAVVIAELKQEQAANDALLIKCYTPLGIEIIVQAKNIEHAAFLRHMNPKPADS